MHIDFNSKKLTKRLALVGLVLSLISFSLHAIQYFWGFRIHPKILFYLDINQEHNIPSLYSALLLLLSAILILVIAATTQKARKKHFWQGLSAIFLFLAADEMLELHENINRFLNGSFGVGDSVSNTGRWDVFSLILFAAVALTYVRFLLSLPQAVKRLFILAAITFVVGGAGIELFGVSLIPNLYQNSGLFSQAIASIEEFFEILGSCIFIAGLAIYIESMVGPTELQFFSSETRPNRVQDMVPSRDRVLK